MTNPFKNECGHFLVLVIEGDQHPLQPLEFDIPDGWNAAFGMRTASPRVATDTAPH
ncbi:MbtH family NRPS accessory protein [Streptomyces sp. TE33382]